MPPRLDHSEPASGMTAPLRGSPAANPCAGGAVVLAATVLAYLPALRGGFIWDDAAHVTRPDLQSWEGLRRIWLEPGATQQYYPLLHSAFWLEHRLWGDAPLGYHLLNVVLHATAACLLAVVLHRLLNVQREPSPGATRPSAGFFTTAFPWIAALLFALHPVAVDSVAWVSEQKNTLSAVFYLASAAIYLRFDRERRKTAYGAALGLFVLALLTKTVTATLPAALLVLLWWRRGRLGWSRDVFPLVPWLALGVTAGLFTAWVERWLIGARGADFSLTLVQRCLLAGRTLWFYLGKLVWPADLVFIYPRWTLDATAVRAYRYPLGAIGLAAGLWALARSRRPAPADPIRAPLAGFLIFAGTLFPALGFVDVYPFLFSYVADHFAYLASVGVLVPAAAGLALAADGSPHRWPGWAAIGLLLLVLGTLTWRQCGIYRGPETLFRATLARNPDCAMAHNGLGEILLHREGGRAEAIAHFRTSLRLNPHDALTHNNLGTALAREPGRLAEAIAEYEAALRLLPEFAGAHNNLGVALEQIPGRRAEAVAHLEEAVQIEPDSAFMQDNLGVALTRFPGRLSEAVAHLEAGVRLDPASADLHNNLALALARLPGRGADALAHFETAATLRPDSAPIQANLGALLALTPGRLAEAIGHLEAAVRLDPTSARAHDDLGNALAAASGRQPEAAAQLEAAVSLDPHSAKARSDLGRILLQMPGRLSDAIAQFEAALRIDPNLADAHNDLAVALLQQPGREPDAIAHLRTATQIDPRLARAHYLLGVVLSAQPGQRDPAVAELEIALRLQPDFAAARELLARLQAR